GHNGEKRKNQTWVEEIAPENARKANCPNQRRRRKAGISDNVDREQGVGHRAVAFEEESVGNNSGCHDQRETAWIQDFDLIFETIVCIRRYRVSPGNQWVSLFRH